MRDAEKGLTNIEALRGVQYSHEPQSEVRSRRLPMHIQEILYDVIKCDLCAKPGNLRERLEEITRVYGQSEGDAHTEGITPSQLSRLIKMARKSETKDYFEESIDGSHKFIQGHQRNEDDQHLHSFYFSNSPHVQGKRINLVISTDALLKNFHASKIPVFMGFSYVPILITMYFSKITQSLWLDAWEHVNYST